MIKGKVGVKIELSPYLKTKSSFPYISPCSLVLSGKPKKYPFTNKVILLAELCLNSGTVSIAKWSKQLNSLNSWTIYINSGSVQIAEWSKLWNILNSGTLLYKESSENEKVTKHCDIYLPKMEYRRMIERNWTHKISQIWR